MATFFLRIRTSFSYSFNKIYWELPFFGKLFSSFFDWCAVSIENVLENEHLKFEKCVFGQKWHILIKNDQKSITSSNLVPRWSPYGPQRSPKWSPYGCLLIIFWLKYYIFSQKYTFEILDAHFPKRFRLKPHINQKTWKKFPIFMFSKKFPIFISPKKVSQY